MRRGQVVVEVMIALAVAVVALVGLVQLANKSVTTSGYSNRQAQATAAATQALEYIRSQKATLGWNTFKSTYPGTSEYCFNGSTLASVPSGGSCSVNGTELSSRVTMSYVTPTPPGPAGIDMINVTSQVFWDESGQTHYSTQTTQLVRF